MKQILGLTQTPSYSELDQEAISPQHVYKRHKRTNLSSLLSYSIGRTISIVLYEYHRSENTEQTSIVLLHQIKILFPTIQTINI